MATERGRYRFVVKEGGEGKPCIVAEPAGDTIDTIDQLGGLLGFDLQPGIGLPEAHEIANKLNHWVTSIMLLTR